MAKTTYKEVVTTGEIEWARIFEFNRDMEGYQGMYEECEGAYTLTQILSKEEMEKLRKSGSQKKPNMKRLEDGVRAVKFERKHLVKTKAGEIVPKAGGAPIVVKADDTPWNSDEDGLIGNGSIAEVTNLIQTFEVTNDKGVKEKASRTALSKVKILERVEYIKPEENN